MSSLLFLILCYLCSLSRAVHCPDTTHCDLTSGEPHTLHINSLELPASEVLSNALLSTIRKLYVTVNTSANGQLGYDSLCQLPVIEHLYWDGGGVIDIDLANISWSCANGLRRIDFVHFVTSKYPVDNVIECAELANLTALSLTHSAVKSLDGHLLDGCAHLENIDLSTNQLASLPDELLTHLGHLNAMNISYNNISNLSNIEFGLLYKLEILDVSHNNLYDLTFLSSQRLKILNASFNQIESLSPNTFHHINAVEIIDLSFNKIANVEAGVFGCQLRYLKRLSLAGNQISTVFNHAFQGLVSLISLDLSHNILTQIPHDTFAVDESNSQIFQLCLSTSVQYSARPLNKQSTKYNLFTENLSILDKGLDSDKDKLKVVNGPWPMFRNLNLSYNKIGRISPECFSQQLALVRNIDISYNRLEHIPRDGLEHLLFLECINISHNKINWLDVGVFNNPKLRSINLSHNRLTKIISMAFLYLPALQTLDLSYNRINYIYKMAFYRTCKHGQKMSIDLQTNRLRDDALLKIVNCFKHLQDTACTLDVNLRRNSFKHLFQQPTTTLQLNLHDDSARYFKTWDHVLFDINENKISCDCRLYSDLAIFSKMENLFASDFNHVENLNFWHNITCSNSRKYAGLTLSEFKKYSSGVCKEQYGCPNKCDCIAKRNHIIVNCSSRHLQQPPSKLPAGPKVVYLDGNHFGSLKYLPSQYKQIESINLSFSSITAVSLGAWRILNQIKSVNLKGNKLKMLPVDVESTTCVHDLSISSNPLSCDCSAENLVMWLLNCSDTLTDIDQIYCADDTYLMDLYDRPCYLHDYSNFISSFVVTLTSMSVTFIAVLIIALTIYCYRNKIVQCITGKQKWYKVHAEDIVKYDVLILHCKDDMDTVMFGILPLLQRGGHFSSICIQHRDWPRNQSLLSSFQEAVQKSHNVLIIASEKFAANEMQNSCYAASVNAMLDDKNISLCIVALDGTSIHKLDSCVHNVLSYNQEGFGTQLISSLQPGNQDIPAVFNEQEGMSHVFMDTAKY